VHADRVHAVQLSDGRTIEADAIVLAVGPAAAAKLLSGAPQEALQGWAEAARPVHAACLDLGLSRLTCPEALFALGIDQPMYYSVHSASARLAPPGGAVVHVAKYLDPDMPSAPASDERVLEELMDAVQPGWREHVVVRRFLPKMLVSNALPTATLGGFSGRPGPAVPGVEGLFVAGDWVGPRGMLADAAMASAEAAAEAAVRHAARPLPSTSAR
ncbi:MAG TPA: FAD-dependent oxidoreductase, partial [Stenomitos sp.]